MTLMSSGRTRTSSAIGRMPKTIRLLTAGLLGLVADGRSEIPVGLDLDDVVARIGQVDFPLLLGRAALRHRRGRQERRPRRAHPLGQRFPVGPRQDDAE